MPPRGSSFTDDGAGNISVDGAAAQSVNRFLQSLTFPGLNFKYINPLNSGTYSNPYGVYVGSGASLVDTILTKTVPGVYTVYMNRNATDVPEAAAAASSSLRGLVILSQIKKHYAIILLVDQSSNFYVQYIQSDVGGGWKQMPDSGADGITPTIGPNGNWFLGTTDTGKPSRGATGAKGDTGATGPAGAPGKDGAGMDITGATVGQIAKITAVDASGVPTAWSPVDMPSGGGDETWELINEVTLSEDAMAVVFDKDKNGAAFALRKFVIVGKTKGSNASNTRGGTICINVANTADDNYSIVPPTGHASLKGDQFRYWHAVAESIAEKGWRWYLTGADNTWKTNQVTIGTMLKGVSQTIPKVATYLAVWSRTSGDAFAAGSKIELYGVRA